MLAGNKEMNVCIYVYMCVCTYVSDKRFMFACMLDS